MPRHSKLDIILENLTIEAVAAEGKAIAHTPEGQVVFVGFAVPGDVVDVRLVRKKKAWLEGTIIRIVKPSEQRLEPFCQHFGVCGGCRWQPLPYEIQLAAKQRQVYDQLTRIGHLELPELSPILGSDKTVRYRNKLEFSASSKRWLSREELESGIDAGPGLGFHVGKFFDKVLDIECCHLQPEPTNAIRLFIKRWCLEHGVGFYDIRENHGQLRNMFVRTTDAGAVMVIVCFGEDFPQRVPLLEAVAEAFPQISSLYYVINGKKNDTIGDLPCILFRGEEAIYEQMEGLRFKIGPKSFYQTNTGQAYKLYKVARAFAALTGDETVYDLYTGTGTIAQFVAASAKRVIGIEYVPEAIADAKVNAEGNGITNCEFYAGDMKDILRADFIAEHGRPDVVIVDPPRAGMHPDVVETILQAAPERIVYVSCNPATQARDMEMMSGQYRITAVQPVDMFPHTFHVENVCRLERIPEEENTTDLE
ncbi:MAG: 23S rRNA (uracil(1939)-C(5))-methyltransferase RlmD [Bacteroidales bacterium]|nr:23S rRNA (uracil(1939)-C(5))-methyltransferase RlmD [Bacteroidales bacterium]